MAINLKLSQIISAFNQSETDKQMSEILGTTENGARTLRKKYKLFRRATSFVVIDDVNVTSAQEEPVVELSTAAPSDEPW